MQRKKSQTAGGLIVTDGWGKELNALEGFKVFVYLQYMIILPKHSTIYILQEILTETALLLCHRSLP